MRVNRLDAIFARAGDRRLVIPYLCAGDPDATTSRCVLGALHDARVEIVEVGIPYGDALGDGRTIARAAGRALAGGMTLGRTLDLCASVPNPPAIVLFGYLNAIAAYGIERFAADAARAGVSGAIVVDLPYEESDRIRKPLQRHGIALIGLISPTTPLRRAVCIAQSSDGFAYVVSRLGVTGAASEPDLDALERRLQELRANTDRRIAVGFGISNPAQVARIARCADAVVVGSALIDALDGLRGGEAATAAKTFLDPLLLAAESPMPGRGTLYSANLLRAGMLRWP